MSIEQPDPHWIPEDPDASIRLAYKTVVMDVPRKAFLTCKAAFTTWDAKNRSARKNQTQVWLDRNLIDASGALDSCLNLAKAVITWNVLEELEKDNKQ